MIGRKDAKIAKNAEKEEQEEMTTSATIPMTENEVAKIVVDAGFHIHQTVGPGLLASAYEMILACELTKRGLVVQRQQAVPVVVERPNLVS